VAIVYLPSEEKDAAETEALVAKEGRRCVRIVGDVGSHDVRGRQRGGLGGGLRGFGGGAGFWVRDGFGGLRFGGSLEVGAAYTRRFEAVLQSERQAAARLF
jgi:hypothetical protein